MDFTSASSGSTSASSASRAHRNAYRIWEVPPTCWFTNSQWVTRSYQKCRIAYLLLRRLCQRFWSSHDYRLIAYPYSTRIRASLLLPRTSPLRMPSTRLASCGQPRRRTRPVRLRTSVRQRAIAGAHFDSSHSHGISRALWIHPKTSKPSRGRTCLLCTTPTHCVGELTSCVCFWRQTHARDSFVKTSEPHVWAYECGELAPTRGLEPSPVARAPTRTMPSCARRASCVGVHTALELLYCFPLWTLPLGRFGSHEHNTKNCVFLCRDWTDARSKQAARRSYAIERRPADSRCFRVDQRCSTVGERRDDGGQGALLARRGGGGHRRRRPARTLFTVIAY